MNPLLTNILSDDAGNPSSARVVLLWVYLVVFIIWAVECFRLNRLVEIPDSVVFVLMALIGAKVAQKKFAEAISPIEPSPTGSVASQPQTAPTQPS